MATININNEKYELPERLTIEQYQNCIGFDWENPVYYPKIVSQLTGIPLPLMKSVNEDGLVLAISLIVHSMNVRTPVNMKPLDSLTFGEFIDLDVWVNLGVDKHLAEIAQILCPDAQWADEAMWAVEEFNKFRMFTFRQYKILFGITDKDLEEAKDKLGPKRFDPMQLARSWYRVIVGIAGEDILKIDRVTDEPLKKVLNFMALQKEKQLEEQQRQLQQKRQYDLSRTRR